MLSIQDIKKSHGPKQFKLNVPEWGGEILAKRLSAAELIKLRGVKLDGSSEEQNFRYMTLLVRLSLVEPVISEADEYLLTDNPMLTMRLANELIELNGMNRDVAKKNLKTRSKG